MSPDSEPLAERLARDGALTLDAVLRIVPPVCDVLVRLGEAGRPAIATVGSIHLGSSGAPTLSPVPFDGGPREQVRHLAALTYELLKGLPPPREPTSADFIGLRPELVRALEAALLGTGASDLPTFTRQLRALGSGGTAQIEVRAADTRISTDAPGLVGQIFGAFQLVRKLGEGGMGEVYVGRHTRLGREVAIKVLRAELASMPDVVQRFFQEARVVNELKHPNTVEILDFVEEPGRVYLVMELLEGRTLAELDRAEGPLPVHRVARLLSQVCAALEAAHQKGVVHRDIKPENLFVVGAASAEQVKVLDFGVARRLNGASQTQAGLVLGTPYYMAPEQAAGRAVDGRADLYAVGVTLYELLTRDSMSTVSTPQRLTRAASGELLPEPLSQLVSRLLAIDPSARPATALDAQRVLEAIAARPAPPAAPSTVQALRHAGLDGGRSMWPLLVSALALLAAVLVAGWRLGRSDDALVAPPVARVEPPQPLPALEPVDAGAAPAIEKPPPRPVVKKPKAVEVPVDPLAALRPRLTVLQRRFERLVTRYGEAQLTTLEKATVTEALGAAAAGSTELDEALTAAEHALDDAERRLGH